MKLTTSLRQNDQPYYEKLLSRYCQHIVTILSAILSINIGLHVYYPTLTIWSPDMWTMLEMSRESWEMAYCYMLPKLTKDWTIL